MVSPEFVLERNIAQAHAMYQAEHAQLHKRDVEYLPGFPLEGKYRLFRNQSRVECLSRDGCAAASDVMKMMHNIIIRFLN